MASNFQRPQLGQARLKGAQIGNAPTIDRAAHAQADQASANIDALNRIGQTVVKKVSDKEKAGNVNEARRATANLPSEIDQRVRRQADKDGVPYRRLSNEQLSNYTTQALSEFYDESGINDSAFSNEAKQMGDELGIRSLGKFGQVRDQENLAYNTGVVSERTSVQSNVLHKGGMSISTYMETLNNDLELDATAIGSVYGAKAAQLKGIIGDIVANGNPEAVGVLESDEAKKYFENIPEYKNMVQMGRNKSIANVNKRKQQNFKAIEEQGYAIADGGGFTTSAEVDSFMEEQLEETNDSLYSPSSKQVFRLRQQLYKGAAVNTGVEGYRESLRKGDNTYLKSSGLKPKEQEAIITKHAKQEIGMIDFSPNAIDGMLIDKGQRDSFTRYIKSGQPVPEQLRVWAKERPINGFEGYKQKYVQYQEIASISEGRINDIFDKKSQNEMLFMGNLLNRDVEESVKQETFAAFQNDINKNVDSFGNYYSSEASNVLKDEDLQSDIASFSKDAPWTTDDNLSSVYTARQVKSSMSMYLSSGHTPEQAFKMSKEVFNRTHDYVEMPNGEEGVITPSFREVGGNVEDMTKFVMANETVRKYIETTQIAGNIASKGLLSDILIGEGGQSEDDIAFRPVPQYEKTLEYQVFFRGTLIPNTRFTPKEFQLGLSEINKVERTRIEEERPNNRR